MSDPLVLVADADGIRRITVNRPDKLNALTAATLDALQAAFDAAATDDAVRVVVLTGAGPKAFVAGADIAEMADLRPTEGRDFSLRGQRLMRSIETLPKPVVAMVAGCRNCPIFKVCPGGVTKAKRSVNSIAPEKPVTGPKAPAKSSPDVRNRPALVTPAGDQLMRPSPDISPLTLATTPSVTGVIDSGCSKGPNSSAEIGSSASPMPVAKLWVSDTRLNNVGPAEG